MAMASTGGRPWRRALALAKMLSFSNEDSNLPGFLGDNFLVFPKILTFSSPLSLIADREHVGHRRAQRQRENCL